MCRRIAYRIPAQISHNFLAITKIPPGVYPIPKFLLRLHEFAPFAPLKPYTDIIHIMGQALNNDGPSLIF